MKLSEIIKIVDGKYCTPEPSKDILIYGGCGADLMSDVLAIAQPESILLTGLNNPQTIRTAQMADIRAIIFVRGKSPSAEMIEIAEREGIPLITSPHGMFELCGRLHSAGLPGHEDHFQE